MGKKYIADAFVKNGATADDILVGDGSTTSKAALLITLDGSITGAKLAVDLKSRIVVAAADIDWSLGIEFTKTLTAAITLTDSNLPTGTDTKCIVLYITGEYAITTPSYWKKHGTGAYDGTKINLFVIDCLNGTSASEDVKYAIIPAV